MWPIVATATVKTRFIPLTRSTLFSRSPDPLNGNSSKTLCLFTTDQARKFVVKMYSMHDDDLLPFSPFTVDIKNGLQNFF